MIWRQNSMPSPEKALSGEYKETARFSTALKNTFFIFFSGPFSAIHPDQTTQAMAPHLNRYFHDGLMDQLAAAHTKALRAIPINKTIENTICNCCNCSCAFFESYHVLKHPKSHDFSNYRVKINPATFKACGLCVERCPVQALTLDDFTPAGNNLGKAAALDAGRCLGCGVCVHKCPTRSLILERREETCDPPKDKGEWLRRWIADRKQAPK